MVLLDNLKNAAIRYTDISNKEITVPVNRSGERTRIKRTVIDDVLKNPEGFEIVGYLEKDEIVFRLRRRSDVTKESLGNNKGQ